MQSQGDTSTLYFGLSTRIVEQLRAEVSQLKIVNNQLDVENKELREQIIKLHKKKQEVIIILQNICIHACAVYCGLGKIHHWKFSCKKFHGC